MLNRAIVHLFKDAKDGKPANQLTNGFTASSFAYSVSSSPLLGPLSFRIALSRSSRSVYFV